jgi:hypothetical protein
MTASAKEVIAAAILKDLDAIAYAEDDAGIGVDGWVNPEKLSTAILAALDAAGLVVVPREPTEAIDAAWMAGYPHDYQQGREVYRAMIAAQESKP